MAINAVALAGIVGFPLLWPTSHSSISSVGVAAALARLAGDKPATRHHLVRGRRKVMYEIDTAARRDDPARLTSGVDARRVADISMASAKALDDLWQRAMKISPRAEGLRDNSARKAAQRIVKEIRARRNPEII
jgi:hypothetical protein